MHFSKNLELWHNGQNPYLVLNTSLTEQNWLTAFIDKKIMEETIIVYWIVKYSQFLQLPYTSITNRTQK